jgi:hypothetical protein
MGDAENMRDSRHCEDERITDVTEQYRNLLHEAMLISKCETRSLFQLRAMSAAIVFTSFNVNF